MLRLFFFLAVLFLSFTPGSAKEVPLPLSRVARLATSNRLEPADVYLRAARKARAVFLRQGGLVELPPDVPTLILPDLHAQRDYLLQALRKKQKSSTVFEEMGRGRMNVLCLGDAMHSEERNLDRWLKAEKEGPSSPALAAEMVESLGLLRLICELKVAYPNHFFFVRGNHEDMDPLQPYRKLTTVGESNLVKAWVLHHFGASFLQEWHGFEGSLPLLARGGSFLGSHAAPEQPLSVRDVQNRLPRAFRALCWSDNTVWAPGGLEQKAFEANCTTFHASPGHPWIVGHRKVRGALYRSQLSGMLIQINPLGSDPRVVVLAPPRGIPFDPRRDVTVLTK